MSERPSQKLKLSVGKVPKSEPQDSPVAPPSASTSTTGPPIKIKFGKKSVSKTPAFQAPDPSTLSTPSTLPTSTKKPKPARKPKPTPKKRALEEDPLTSSNDEEPLASKSTPGPAKKRIRLSVGGAHNPPSSPSATGKKPTLLVMTSKNPKGRRPKRPRGVGYDSEASDRELDPVITESIILRMAPGPDCDYLRSTIAAGNFGPKKDGGADVRLRFLRSDGRRACLKIRKNQYAAILVDLPCVIEAMKSWFPKTMGWMKSADICQMLMVLGKVAHESEALDYPLPTGVKGEFDEKTWQWAHGLTPPMHWVRKRRFRKRISVRTVMEVEAEVEEMLRLDASCEGEPIIEEIYERPNRGSDLGSDDEEEGEAFNNDDDAEGEFIDETDHLVETPLDTIEAAEDEEAAHARMAEEYEREMMLAISTEPSPTPADQTPPSLAPTPPSLSNTTPASQPQSHSSSPSSDEDSDEEEELDESQQERAQELQKVKEEVRDLDELVRAEQGKLAATGNQLLKRRIVEKIKGLTQDRELKLAAAGLGGE